MTSLKAMSRLAPSAAPGPTGARRAHHFAPGWERSPRWPGIDRWPVISGQSGGRSSIVQSPIRERAFDRLVPRGKFGRQIHGPLRGFDGVFLRPFGGDATDSGVARRIRSQILSPLDRFGWISGRQNFRQTGRRGSCSGPLDICATNCPAAAEFFALQISRTLLSASFARRLRAKTSTTRWLSRILVGQRTNHINRGIGLFRTGGHAADDVGGGSRIGDSQLFDTARNDPIRRHRP